MKRNKATVERLAMTLKPPWPRQDLPHIAVAGRSNVGKSSLLNALFGRKNLAAVSKSPGKTKSLQFFLVGDRLILCDLPGYGYAQVSKALRRLWNGAIERYMLDEAGPAGVVALIDGRHPPSAQDVQLAGALTELGKPWLPVLTKADKVGRGKRHAHARVAAQALGCDAGDLVWTSAETGEGLDELWQAVWELAP